MRTAAGALPVIHAVTNDEIVRRPGFVDRAAGVMRALGPRGAIHLRAHLLGGRELYELARSLAAEQVPSGAWLVVNDRLDVALAAGAWAAQLAGRSLAVADARRVAPALPLGASVHSADDGRAARDAGAAWLVAGHIFDTPSHTGVPARGARLLRALAGYGVPVVAIGGVRPEHARSLRAAGAGGVAAIRGIWGDSVREDDAERAARRYLSAYGGDGDS